MDPIDEANEVLREKGYDARDLGVHAGMRGRALLKGNAIVSPFSDEGAVVLRVVRELVPAAAELGNRHLRPADLRAKLG